MPRVELTDDLSASVVEGVAFFRSKMEVYKVYVYVARN